MANSAQACKRARQAVTRRARNMSHRSTLRTAIKKVQLSIQEGDKEAAQVAFRQSQCVIDHITDKQGVVNKNKAARHKSRLSAAIKAMA